MRPRSPHGVTLVEMLVAVAASAIVLVGVLGAVRAQQQAYQGGQKMREAQGSARNALLFIEQKLAFAGWGMDPVLAFDLSGQPGDADTTKWYVGPCPTDAEPCDKDRVDGSDELVFQSRNPNYWARSDSTELRGRVWSVVDFAPADDKITLAARKDQVFRKGQILQGVCDQGQGQRYFTVAETTPSTPLDADQALQIPLVEDVLGDPFKRQNAGSCAPTRVFQIDRYRFHVRPVPLGDGRYEPFLVLDMGVDQNLDKVVDDKDELLLASGVEIMQVAYQFTAGSGLPDVGRTPGTVVKIDGGTAATADKTLEKITRTSFAASADKVDAKYYENASFYSYSFGPPLAAQRTTNHQANLGSIQVLLVARSTTPRQEEGSGLLPGADAPVLNLNKTPTWISTYATAHGGKDGYERIRLDTTVLLPNLVARRLLYE